MIPPEIAFTRFLFEKHERGEKKYAEIGDRIVIETLPPNNLYRWFADWMNHQLSDVGVTSTDGAVVPTLHFELVHAQNHVKTAHMFEAGEFGFVVMTQPMFDEMLMLSDRFVEQNPALTQLQLAPSAPPREVAQLLLLIQFSLVTSHEYSHIIRGHLKEDQPQAAGVGESLVQAQELDADGLGIYHQLTYFFKGGGRRLASEWLHLSRKNALDNSILSCFLIAVMIQFCSRWAGKAQVEANVSAEHPPQPMRIEHAILITEMWCREVGAISTSWLADGTLNAYFAVAARLFPAGKKAPWAQLISWLKSPQSDQYRSQIRRSSEHLRTKS